MNPEQEVLVKMIAENPVLRLVAYLIAKHPDQQVIDLLRVISKSKTGLSETQSKKALDWLIRKGFLRQLTEEQYPRLKARYSFSVELKQKAIEWNCTPFGSLGRKMLEATAEKFNLPSSDGGNVILWTWPNSNVLDHYGRLVQREEAMEISQALDRYMKKYEMMTEEEFERHRDSHAQFLWWGRVLNPYGEAIQELRYSGTVAKYLKPPVCTCHQCKEFHDLAFTTLTNYFNYEKQEKKQIRAALKALD